MAEASRLARMPRRWVLAMGAAVVAEGCLSHRTSEDSRSPVSAGGDGAPGAQGRLTARPRRSATGPVRRGVHSLGLGWGRDGMVYVPAAYQPGRAPLMLWLHGAGGRGTVDGVLRRLADATGLLAIAPDARGRTWDVVLGGWGPDVAFVDRALAQVFERYAVDPDRVVVAGFSDGASYALSLGLANGDLFGFVMAFSPGFVAPAPRLGRPRVFISHGTHDSVLPIDRTSRRIVPSLRRDGYEVRYQEFNGGHRVPPEMARAAIRWMVRPRVR
jgi:phospholipase/carboxylesterase